MFTITLFITLFFYRYVWPEEVAEATGIHEDVNHDVVWINVRVAYNHLHYSMKHVHAQQCTLAFIEGNTEAGD